MTYKINWTNAVVEANKILAFSNTIKTFPFSVVDVINEFPNVSLCSYSRARELGIESEKFGSDSAFMVEKNGKYIIFFNDMHPRPRKRFSIIHENGHFVLMHRLDTVSENLYDILELEANYFAAQLLMPSQIIYELDNRGVQITEDFIMGTFGVSREAASKRLEHLRKVKEYNFNEKESEHDEIILSKYKRFMDDIKPKPIYKFELDFINNSKLNSQLRF